MKLKINKACDLNFISVLPPRNRRSSIVAMQQQQRSQPSQQSFSQGFSSQQNGLFSQISQNSRDEALLENQRFGSQERENSVRRVSCLAPISYPRGESQIPVSGRSNIVAMQQQQRSQPSQQSFSQGFSSQQNGVFSQNSLDDTLIDNQRFGSQEKENSVRRVSCLAPISYPREESQIPVSRSSSNLTRRWSTATVPDHKCQLSDELEHKITMMETSLTRFGMIMDSVQADVMQVNKGTKELSLEVEGIRQKSTAHDDSLHLLNRGQDDIKATLDVGFKLIDVQFSRVAQQEKLEQILSEVSNLPEIINTTIQTCNEQLYKYLSEDLQAISSGGTILNQINKPLAILAPKFTGAESSSHNPFVSREAGPTNAFKKEPCAPSKVEMGSWNSVKAEKLTSPYLPGNPCKNLKQQRISPMVRRQKAVIELDDSDEELSCFIVENELGNPIVDEVNEVYKATERILRKARKRKRKESFKRLIRS